MEITTSQEQGRVPVTVFHLKGELDAVLAEQLRQHGRDAIAAGARYFLVDLSDVPYIASAGLRAFQELFTSLRDGADEKGDQAVYQGLRDGTYKSPNLKLVSPTRHALEALSTAGFDMFLEIHRDLRDAVASF
jgi:anti-anti-sigma factor